MTPNGKPVIGRRRRRVWLIRLAVAGLAGLALLYLALAVIWPYPEARLSPQAASSRQYLDRTGADLRVADLPGGTRATWTPLDRMGPWLGLATVAIEDHRFRYHPGLDPFAIARAAAGNLVRGRIVSGGSTLTQQLARLLSGATRRGNWSDKLVEAWDALRLERQLDKDAILEQYLNRAPYGNQCTGVAAAAALYFGKAPDRLSLAEAALLAGLTKAPTAFSPYAQPEAARRRQQTVLDRLRGLGWIADDDYRRAQAEPLAVQPPRAVYRAPHFLAALDAGALGPLPTDTTVIRTTLDLGLQTAAEGLVKGHLARLADRNAGQAAAVVLDARDGAILAWVGSPDFFTVSQVDGVLARRQPGSALKPFTYALALDAGRTAADLIADVPLEELPDGFQPENYDRDYHGPVRLREALGCSYNVPAVRVLKDYVGTDRLLEFLRAAGFASLDRAADHYGLALTLGAGEVRLLELARGYALLARGGVTLEPRGAADGHIDAPGVRLLTEEAAALITSILADATAREAEFGRGGPLHYPFPVAVKTGTSKDYRDNWCVAYTPRHVVAVWVGNFDGSPMRNCSGVTGAAPLVHDIMLRAGAPDGAFAMPPGLVACEICPLSGRRPGPACPGRVREWFRAGTQPTETCDFHRLASGAAVEAIPARYRDDGFRAR